MSRVVIVADGKRWAWDKDDEWSTFEAGGLVAMKAGEMQFTADREGNWLLEYSAEIPVARHRWIYGFQAIAPKGTPLFTLVPQRQMRFAGRYPVLQAGRSADLRRDFQSISHWARVALVGGV